MKATLTAARQLLADGETEKAIDLLSSGLHASIDGKSDYLDQLTLLSGAWSSYQKKLNIGTLAGTEAAVEGARLNERLLALMNDIGAGRESEPTVQSNSKRYLWLAVAAGILLLAGLAFWYNKSRALPKCPTFASQPKWKIAVLPFTNLGDRAAKPEQVLASTINQITAKNGLSVEATVWDASQKRIQKQEQKLLEKCGTDLLITGQYVILQDDSLQVSLNYQFSDMRPAIQTDFYGFRNIAALSSGQFKDNSITDAIFSLCTVIALREDNDTLTQKWMANIKQPEDWIASMRTENSEEMARVAAIASEPEHISTGMSNQLPTKIQKSKPIKVPIPAKQAYPAKLKNKKPVPLTPDVIEARERIGQ
jgi:Effector-associated domain 11